MKTLKVGRRSLCGKLECVGSASAVNIYGSTNKLSESSLSTTVRNNLLYKQHESVTKKETRQNGDPEAVKLVWKGTSVRLSNCGHFDATATALVCLYVQTAYRKHTKPNTALGRMLDRCKSETARVRSRLLAGHSGHSTQGSRNSEGHIKTFQAQRNLR